MAIKKTAKSKAAPKKVEKPTPKKSAEPKKAPVKATKAPEIKKSKGKTTSVAATPVAREKVTHSSGFTLKPVKTILGRHFFVEELDAIPLPDLLEVQKRSYAWFLKDGIRELLDEISPVQDSSGKKLELNFLNYTIEPPKYGVHEVKKKNLNYEGSLKVHVELINKETGEIKEQDVYLGTVPLMTDDASFIINGIERVVVNQIVRAQGVFFSENAAAPGYYTAKIIPKRGAWLEIETDKKGLIYVKIDRKRKIPVTALIKAFGWETDEAVVKEFADLKLSIDDDYIMRTLEKDPTKNADEAYQLIYKRIRPGDLATSENARGLIQSMFFDFKKYDMGVVARYKINKKFGIDEPFDREHRILQRHDLIMILKHLINLNRGTARGDDIDHLSNRRVVAVGESIQKKFRVGILRTERIVRDRMSILDPESVTPTQLINSRPITAALREFFTSSQLSQFMEQTNPLSEIEHKRRLSAMGPGGLSRERAGFEVRDVHSSHYGRICPIATPEGPNIGLVVHLASYCKVNDYGFIESPYRTVKKMVPNKAEALAGRIAYKDVVDPKTKKVLADEDQYITEDQAKNIVKNIKDAEIRVRPYIVPEVKYYGADEEENLYIAQANSELDENGNFVPEGKRVSARHMSEASLVHVDDITHMDISPKQILSITTALIPFVEHDDNVRALMGTVMMRQVVPLVRKESPLVGTGMESKVAINAGYGIVAEDDGEVLSVDGRGLSVLYKNGRKANYALENYQRSNQGTVLHQNAVVNKGEKLKKGQPIVDSQGVHKGELALGKNVLVAYMPWYGYNFEDGIVISDRFVKEDTFSSIHIEGYTIDIRETKLGPEILTRDIPNIGDAKLKDLDEDGIIRIGATVAESDILVGKITPKGETEVTAEERLLQAIFGEKAKDVKDASLRLPGGANGKVVDVHVLTRKTGDELPTGVIKQVRVFVAKSKKIEVGDKMAGRHGNKGIVTVVVPQENMPFLEDGTPVDIILNPLGVVGRMNLGQILEAHLGWACDKLGINVASPALDGIKSTELSHLMQDAGLPADGKVQLYDGYTGEAFKEMTVVGMGYMFKLHHLVEDKIHARSVGPYSLVTQQPLGGKAQHGGQRFGEMEVWALEAYGAAYTLQEMLTIKSDDVRGRTKAYEAIVKGEQIKSTNIPASFEVLIKELQSLGLRVDLLTQEELQESAIDENAILDVDDVEEE